MLNSIHKSCKLQNNLFKCDRLGKCHKNTYSPIWQTLFSPLTSMRCTKTISLPGMASYRKSLLTPHRSMMEMCCSCFMDTKYKCLRCTHKMAFNSKSTPTSPNLQRTTYHFVQKRKILERSACESKTIKDAIHVFTQKGNQCVACHSLRFLI